MVCSAVSVSSRGESSSTRSSSTSDANSVQSAYIYAGNYSQQGQKASADFDSTALRMVGLAEIVGVTEGDLVSGSFTTTNPLA